MSGQFIQKIINYVTNEVIIKGLANSKTFQKVAVRTDHHLRQFQKTGEETLNKTLEELTKEEARTAALGNGPPKPPLTGFKGFASAFVKEVRKDMGMLK